MTSLPALDGTPETLQYVIDKLASAAIDTGGRKIRVRFGSNSASFSASNTALATVTHGMGSVPVSIAVIPAFGAGQPYTGAADTATPATSTAFVARLNTNPSSTNVTATIAFYWVAIG